jgi:hypothetical protein
MPTPGPDSHGRVGHSGALVQPEGYGDSNSFGLNPALMAVRVQRHQVRTRLFAGGRSLQRTGLWKSGYGMGLIGLSEHFGQSKPGAVQPSGTHQN